MISPTIEKLTKFRYDANPLADDVRVGLELLKSQYYPNIPEDIKQYLYSHVREDIIREYFDIKENKNRVGIEGWNIKWKENDT